MSHPDDEVLSALLDGEAPPGDVAHVDGCGDCQARVAELRFAAESVARSVPIPPGHLREASLAVALRAADQPVRTMPTLRRFNSGLSAAAVLVVALAVGGLLITQLGRDGGSATNTQNGNASMAAGLATTVAGDRKAASESVSGGSADDFADSGATLSAPADSAMSSASVTDLGDVNDIDAVSKRSSDDLAGRDASGATLAPDTLACPPDAADEAVLWHATLTYKGTAAVATVRQHSAKTRITEIRAREGCSLLASQEFEPTTTR